MSEQAQNNINVIELLMQIREDVSSIKTDMNNLQKNQEKDKASIDKDIEDVRTDFNRSLKTLESNVTQRINNIQTVQNTLVGEVETLKHSEDKEDARKYRSVVKYMLVGIGGLFVAKIPEIIKLVFQLSNGVQ